MSKEHIEVLWHGGRYIIRNSTPSQNLNDFIAPLERSHQADLSDHRLTLQVKLSKREVQ